MSVDTSSPVELMILRIQFNPAGSGPLGMMRIICQLIDELAEERGWNLEDHRQEALDIIQQRREAWEKEQAERREKENERIQAKRRKNYFKKYGKYPEDS